MRISFEPLRCTIPAQQMLYFSLIIYHFEGGTMTSKFLQFAEYKSGHLLSVIGQNFEHIHTVKIFKEKKTSSFLVEKIRHFVTLEKINING